VRIKIETTLDYIIYFIPNYTKKQEKIRKGLTLKIKASLTVTGPLTQNTLVLKFLHTHYNVGPNTKYVPHKLIIKNLKAMAYKFFSYTNSYLQQFLCNILTSTI
jgi:hypothetical protein